MVDLLRPHSESLEDYQRRSQADVRGSWKALSTDEHASFRDHMLKVVHLGPRFLALHGPHCDADCASCARMLAAACWHPRGVLHSC